jgi:hypothetical protein
MIKYLKLKVNNAIMKKYIFPRLQIFSYLISIYWSGIVENR